MARPARAFVGQESLDDFGAGDSDELHKRPRASRSAVPFSGSRRNIFRFLRCRLGRMLYATPDVLRRTDLRHAVRYGQRIAPAAHKATKSWRTRTIMSMESEMLQEVRQRLDDIRA